MKKSPFARPCLSVLTIVLVLTAGCTKAQKARRLLAAAETDYQAQRFDQAEAEYIASLKLVPFNQVAIRQLGLIYAEEGRQQAFPYLKKANEQDGKNLEVQLKLAEIYGNAGKPREAVGLLDSVVQAEPANERALFLLTQWESTNNLSALRQRLQTQLREQGPGSAACHAAMGWIDLRMNNVSEAEAEFQKATALDAKLASPHLGMAIIYSHRNDTNAFRLAFKTAAELSPIRSNERLKYADFEMESGSEDQARQTLLDITRQAPDYIPAWLYLMRYYYAVHQYDQCKATIDTILAKDNSPPNFDASFQAGLVALARQEPAEALRVFQRLDEAYAKSRLTQLKYYLAVAYMMNHDPLKAKDSLDNALAINPDYPPALLMLADMDYHANKFAEAITLLTQLINKNPENVQAQLSLADIYLAQQRPDHALEVYQRMAQLFPKNPEIPRLMGSIYAQTGDVVRARQAFEKSLSLAPDYMPAVQNITDLDVVEQHFAEARQRMEAIIAKNPKLAQPQVMLGSIYAYEGKTNQAESSFNKAIELNPELPGAYLALAQLYLSTHQEQQALDRLNTLVAKTNDLSAILEIGEIHQSKERYEQARDAYEKVLAINPNFGPALNNLAYLDSEYLGKVDAALQLAENARKLYPTDPNTADTLGWILFKKHQYSRALGLIQESADKQPNNPEVQMHLGTAYYMMEQENPARLHLQRALAGKADFPGKDLARRRLDALNINATNATPEVIQKLQDLLQVNPQDPVPLSRMAYIQEQHGEVQKAAESLKTLIAVNPEDWSAMTRLARLDADRLDNLRQALELAKTAHNTAPDDGPTSALFGELVYRTGDYSWSLSLLEQAANQSPDQPSILYRLALDYYAVGRVDDADAAMQKAVDSTNSMPNLEQAKQFQTLRAAVKDPTQLQSAHALARQILAKDGNYVPALMVSALLAEQQGAKAEAIQSFEKVLSIYPRFAPAMRDLAILYSQSKDAGDQKRAYELASKARLSMPDDLELARTLGVLAYGRAEYGTSKPLLVASAEKYDHDPEVFYYLGMDYYQLKQRSDSKKALQHALDLNLAGDMAAKAQATLKELK